MADDDTVDIYGGKCPLGSQCSKKGGTFCKSLCLEEVDAKVRSHLKNSPYHEMADDEIDNVMISWEPLVWQDKKANMDKKDESTRQERAERERSPRRPYTGGYRRVCDNGSGPCGSGGMGGSTVALARQHRAPAYAPHETMEISRTQLHACADALRRAQRAAESCKMLAQKVFPYNRNQQNMFVPLSSRVRAFFSFVR